MVAGRNLIKMSWASRERSTAQGARERYLPHQSGKHTLLKRPINYPTNLLRVASVLSHQIKHGLEMEPRFFTPNQFPLKEENAYTTSGLFFAMR